jgi:phospholipid/cholesterol/gamma-HCH transport system substrate-binding protein
MTLLADKDNRFRNLVGKTAVFLILAVLGIAAIFLLAGVKKGLFTATSPVYFVADSGQDLSEGMSVKLSGFKVGTVKSLALDEAGRVQVEAGIGQKYFALLKEDAVARLKKGGIIGGDVMLEIDRGSEGRKALEAGGTIRFERARGLEEVSIEVRDRLLPMLDELHGILHDPDGDVRQTLKNLREFSVEMRSTRERLDGLLEHADSTLSKEVSPMLRSLERASAHAESVALQLDRSLPVLLRKADGTLDDLKQTSTTIRGAVEQSAPQLPGLLEDTHDIVEGVSRSWPLRNMVPPPESGPIRMDSHD